jgi:methyl-accepting chemotaxis protein
VGEVIRKVGFRLWVALILVAIVVIIFGLYMVSERRAIIDSQVTAARNLVVMSESVRENMAQKWDLGLFSTTELRRIHDSETDPALRKQKVLAVIPVVAAWESAKSKAKEGGFEFRTPREGARNPANEPDVIESEALMVFDKNPDALEHMVIDEEKNTIRYFRPVRLEKVCMNCHGDPATSVAIWGRDDGKDITGFAMDNKQVGDLHGAFEVIKPLDEADQQVRKNVFKGASAVLPLLLLALWFVNRLSRTLFVEPLANAAAICERIAKGDLTEEIEVHSNDEVGKLMGALKAMSGNLNNLVGNVRSSTAEFTRSASEIASGNIDLSSRTEQQAASLEETAASMDQMTTTVQQNADNARQANMLVSEARQRATHGRDVASQTVEAMAAINSSTKRMADIIGVIDEIAFQTNLLALNAAVEAARAGEQGRGFAVVATEVRNLAQRSATSAKEIKDLIRDSTAKVDQGADLVNRTGESLAEIFGAVTNVATMINEIAAASKEQSDGIVQVNQAVSQMDEMTQQNAALVEQSTAAAKSLEEMARELDGLVSKFEVREGAAQLAPPRASAAPQRQAPRPIAKRPPTRAPLAPPRQAPAARPPQVKAAPAQDDEWEEF